MILDKEQSSGGLVTKSCPSLATPWTVAPTRVGSLSLLQGIFPTQGLNPGLLHCTQILYHLNHWGSPRNSVATLHTSAARCQLLISGGKKKGLPSGTSGKEPTYKCRRPRRPRFNPWVGKIPWRRKWQRTLVFLPGESHG